MNNDDEMMTCRRNCWAIALVAGIVVALFLMVLGGWGFFSSLLIGALICVVGGVFLTRYMCQALPPLNSDVKPAVARQPAADPAPTPAAPAAEPAPVAEPAPEPPAPKVEPAATAPVVKPSPRLAGQEDLAARKGEWVYKGEDTSPSPSAAAPSAPATGEGSGPETLSAARDGQADDLKLLKGVGPKLEQTLNELGFYHFDQVAAWTEDHVAWVDDRLKFKGRIERDGWIEQAKILAAGGETEFSKRNK